MSDRKSIRITETNADEHCVRRFTEPGGEVQEEESLSCRACGQSIARLPTWHQCPAVDP